jgi:hypothetical protein
LSPHKRSVKTGILKNPTHFKTYDIAQKVFLHQKMHHYIVGKNKKNSYYCLVGTVKTENNSSQKKRKICRRIRTINI